jgi:precorrin-8X/cobalt-precorrin-8 methylmutase
MSAHSPSDRVIHPIEVRSYEILRSRVDTSAMEPLTRAVVERVIHAGADIDYLTDLVISSERHLERAQEALLAGRPVVTDAEMVAAGITSVAAVCRVKQATSEDSQAAGLTRSAVGMRLALQEVGKGAIWVIGNAPTALEELLKLDTEPALVVGLPVGFVGAVESKEALRSSGLPAISNVSEKGGSAVAAAALNALLYAPPPADQAGSTP